MAMHVILHTSSVKALYMYLPNALLRLRNVM